MKITVIYNVVENVSVGDPRDILADEDTVKTANEIAGTLSGIGYKVDMLAIDDKSVRQLKNYPTDFFFNNAFGINGVPKSESDVARFLERSGKPFSGSGATAIILTTDKVATKEVLSAHGIPTPGFTLCEGERINTGNLNYPVIVKPAAEDCSLGIREGSVIGSSKDLSKQVKSLCSTYAETVMVEEYIDGRELNVTVIGNGNSARALPISEITFGKSFEGKYKIVDFAAKWEEESAGYKDTVGVCPADLPAEISQKVSDIALSACRLTGIKDYARVDIRLSKDNIPFVLEVNANPGIGPSDGAVRSARAAGMDYPKFLNTIIEEALKRSS